MNNTEENKYKIGDKFYLLNRKTKEMKEVQITGIKYYFSSRIPGYNTCLLRPDQIDEALEDGVLVTSEDDFRDAQIRKLEKELGIDMIDYLTKHRKDK